MSKRKRYSPEFKWEAIVLVRRSGASCRQIALEIGVAPNLLTRWIREAQSGGEKAFLGTGSPPCPPAGGRAHSRLAAAMAEQSSSG
ncbi:TPA: transposase [Pseudomonas aeruginosa]|nr:transposase [Pseudomonas aeruginosa]HDQ4061247.1 transposase [Pseudomonas aeruginosa]